MNFLGHRFLLLGTVAGLATSFRPALAQRQAVPDYALPAINYMKATPHDAVAEVQRRVDAGELVFTETGRALLLAVLEALRVPVESQTLVFAKTSLQKALISPSTPRALYFSESIYVGWVPGGLIEVAAIDPQLGPIFYQFKPTAGADGRKGFVRDASCMLCHGYFFIRDIPSLLALTGVPDKEGVLLPRSELDTVDDATRFRHRWGGWYVSGYTGSAPHRGNAFGTGEGKSATLAPEERRPAELSEFFDTSRYPAATSDMVNLLVLEHQIGTYNAITRAGQDARLGRQASEYLVLDRLLFRRAATLPEGIVKANAFTAVFLADARRTAAGESLKELQAEGRLFRNRCSYLIYSDAFAGLPATLKARIYAALFAALHNEDPTDRYGYLGSEEKKRIFRILMATHPEARAHFERLAAKPGS